MRNVVACAQVRSSYGQRLISSRGNLVPLEEKRAVPGASSQIVLADRLGLYVTALDAHCLFDISDGVPSEIISELYFALRNNTMVERLSFAVLPSRLLLASTKLGLMRY
jgi:hypothetical protein